MWETFVKAMDLGTPGLCFLLVFVIIRMYLDSLKKDKEISKLLENRNQQLLDITRECVEKFTHINTLIDASRTQSAEFRELSREIRDLNQQVSTLLKKLD